MTPKEKSTTAQNVKEPSSKDAVDKILKRTEVSPTPLKEEKKRGRGRPRGSKKKTKVIYTKSKYTEQPMAKAINSLITNVTNKTVLKNATDKMDKSELEIGEALVYTIDYYGAGILGHPLMVLVMAFFSMGMITYNKMQTVPKKTEEKKTQEKVGGKL